MEKQAALLSSKLVQGDRLVEVAVNRAVLAWREVEKEKGNSPICSFSKPGKSKTRGGGEALEELQHISGMGNGHFLAHNFCCD